MKWNTLFFREDEYEEVGVDIQNSELNKFLSVKGGGGGKGKKGGKGGGGPQKLPYDEFVQVVRW